MRSATIVKHFNRIGAALDVREREMWAPYQLDVRAERRAERYEIAVRPDVAGSIEFLPLNVRPDLRHLLLMARVEGTAHAKFLCGHDERHWFVAQVPAGATTVQGALDALKPVPVQRAVRRAGLRRGAQNRRRNGAFLRQGEWFFLPEPGYEPPPLAPLLRDEPLARPRGKPHRVQELVRSGGENVYVSPQRPQGISEAAYMRLVDRRPKARRWAWRVQRRNPQVYARGSVRHPDHATIHLPFWHRVAMSREESDHGVVAFLD